MVHTNGLTYVLHSLSLIPIRQPRTQALSLFSSLVFERETMDGLDHVATQNLCSKKIVWQGGVAKSRNRYCKDFTFLGRQGKMIWCYLNALRLRNERAKANHTRAHCLQWLFFPGKHLQALKLYLRRKYCINVYAALMYTLTLFFSPLPETS